MRVPAADRRVIAVLVGLLVLGTGIRMWIAFTNYGVQYDINSAYIVARLLDSHPLHVYSAFRYPYPSGYFPVILLLWLFAKATGAAFWAVWKVPPILADAGIAALLFAALRRLGSTPRERLVSAGLVALGPSFIIISGYHGQIDSTAILAALAGVVVWTLGGERRAWQAGVLIGIGAAIKTVPFFMVFALLPTARSRREAAVMLGCAIAVPLVCVAPFLIDNTHATWSSLTANKGVAGIAGLSVLIQPHLNYEWLHGQLPSPSSVTLFFVDKQNLIVGVAVLAVSALAWRRRLDPIPAAVLIWLTVYVANFNWSYQYFVWGIPFFLLAGRRREVLAMQAALLLPSLQIYFAFGVHHFGWLYLPLMALIWVAMAIALAIAIRRTRVPSTQPVASTA
jgi:hypothetical protein